jgi:uncharacterized protein
MSIQYNVSTLLREQVGSTREYEIDTKVLLDQETPAHQHVTGTAKFLRTNDGLLVSTHLQGAQADTCSRCLRAVDVLVDVDFEEQFYATVDPETGARLPEPEDAEAFRISPQHLLDLEEAVRQSWSVALPMQPLCRLDCKGLCPRCGQDLNEGPCGCGPELDDRWSALRKLATEKTQE